MIGEFNGAYLMLRHRQTRRIKRALGNLERDINGKIEKSEK